MLDEIARTLGEQASARLQAQCSGQRLYVPLEPTPRLIDVLGEDDAQRLSTRFPKSFVHVPCAARRAARNDDIVSAAEAGTSFNDIAAQFEITERHARRIVSSRRRAR